MAGELIEFDSGKSYDEPNGGESVSTMLVDDQPVFRDVAERFLSASATLA
jgi:hypothetical protein